jgi:hypothetical protein
VIRTLPPAIRSLNGRDDSYVLRQGGGMHADDTRAAFAVEIDLLRPGVPLLQARPIEPRHR